MLLLLGFSDEFSVEEPGFDLGRDGVEQRFIHAEQGG